MKRIFLFLLFLLALSAPGESFARSFSLTVTLAGDGTGVAISSPTGITCGAPGGVCSLSASDGTKINLTATPNPGNTFGGWSGHCSGTQPTCSFRLRRNTTVTATFQTAPLNPTVTISLAGTGSGTVACNGGLCQSSYPSGTSLSLLATAGTNSTFSRWAGICENGITNPCNFTLTNNTNVTATFNAVPNPTLAVSKSGIGTLTSSPGSIDCGAVCSTNVISGTQVVLTAIAAQNYTFTGWGGTGVNCSGTGTCPVTVSSNLTVTATFVPVTVTYPLTTAIGAGSGAILCNGGGCAASYLAGTNVTATTIPDSGLIFDHWSGPCNGTSPTCSYTMNDATTLTAYFKKPTLAVVLTPAGTQAVVTSAPSGIDCGITCQATFDAGTVISLAITVPDGSVFGGWSGTGVNCPGTSTTCTLTVTADTTVTAQMLTANGFNYPLKLGPTGRYLVDQAGKPFLLVGDTAWSLIAVASDADADLYLANRHQLGFTAVLVNLIEHQFSHSPPADFYGLLPFTGQAFTTPNEAYFTHVDTILQSAAAKGIVVLLDVLYLGYSCGSQGWCGEVQRASTSDMTTWGQYVGNRYKNYDNLIWVIGGDTDPSSVKAKVQAMVGGILSVDTRHPFTAHNGSDSMAVSPWSGATWLNVNNVYAYKPAYQLDGTAYNVSPAKPFFLIEAKYENEGPNAQALRAQSYWTVLSGGFGHVFGNCPIWGFGYISGFCSSTDWKAQLNSTGSANMQRFQALFNSRHWHTLVPDILHTVLTTGYGSSGQSDYATAAYASDGSSIIAYLPTSRTVTISGAQLTGPTMIAWWYSPATGVATQIGSFATTGSQTFTPPSSGDWVLVLDSATVTLPPPGSN